MKRSKSSILSILIAALLFVSCGISPGRKILSKGSFASEVSVVTFLSGAEYAASPVIPNIEIGLRYGLTDRITVGGTWAGLPLLTKNAILVGNPFIVGQIVPPNKHLPSVNLYCATPFLIPLRLGDFKIVPLLGAVFREEWGRFGLYPIVECSFDSDMFEDKIDLHTNVRLGFDWVSRKETTFTIECGIDNIGYRYYGGNLTYGFPCLHFGITNLIKEKSQRLSR